MNNNEKIKNKTFLDNQKQKGFKIKEFITASFEKTLGTYIMYSDDSLEEELVMKLSKIRKNAKENINSHLQKYSTFDN